MYIFSKRNHQANEWLSKIRCLALAASLISGFVVSESLWAGCTGSYCDLNHTTYASACDVACVAAPVITSYAVTVTIVGDGLVKDNQSQINCGSQCTGRYNTGTSVDLIATPNVATGSTFVGWSGSGCNPSVPSASTLATVLTQPSLSLFMNKTQICTATFSPPVKLTVATVGNGTVISEDTFVSCGNACTKDYTPNTKVTLLAVPATGYQFVNWTSSNAADCTGTTTTLALTMAVAKNCTANFSTSTPPTPTITTYTLSIAKTDGGSVTSNPAGINCAAGCSTANATYNANPAVTVTLAATPDTGYQATSWGGDCQGKTTLNSVTGVATTTVTVDKAKTCSTNFTKVPPISTLTFPNVKNASISSISITPTTVKLDAIPAPGFKVDSWSGDCDLNGIVTLSGGFKACSPNSVPTSTPPTTSKTDQTITFNMLSNKTVGDGDVTLNPSASSNLPVNLTLDSNSQGCSLVGNTVKILSAGICVIKADQAGNDKFNAAPTVTQSFTIVANNTTTQCSNNSTPASTASSPTIMSLLPTVQSVDLAVGKTLKVGFESLGNFTKTLKQLPDATVATATIAGDLGEVTLVGTGVGKTIVLVEDANNHLAAINVTVNPEKQEQTIIVMQDTVTQHTDIKAMTEETCFNQGGLLTATGDCVQATSLNSNASMGSTAITFRGGVSKRDATNKYGNYKQSETVQAKVDSMKIAGVLKIDPADKGKKVDVLAVILHQSTLYTTGFAWFNIAGCSDCLKDIPTKDGLPIVEKMEPLKTLILNNDYLTVYMLEGALAYVGLVDIYFGYRVVDTGKLVFNNTPISINSTE